MRFSVQLFRKYLFVYLTEVVMSSKLHHQYNVRLIQMDSSTVIAPYIFYSQTSNKKFPKTTVILKAFLRNNKGLYFYAFIPEAYFL